MDLRVRVFENGFKQLHCTCLFRIAESLDSIKLETSRDVCLMQLGEFCNERGCCFIRSDFAESARGISADFNVIVIVVHHLNQHIGCCNVSQFAEALRCCAPDIFILFGFPLHHLNQVSRECGNATLPNTECGGFAGIDTRVSQFLLEERDILCFADFALS